MLLGAAQRGVDSRTGFQDVTTMTPSGRATDEQTKQPEERSIERGGGIGTGGLGSKFGQHFPPIRCETVDAFLSEEVRI